VSAPHRGRTALIALASVVVGVAGVVAWQALRTIPDPEPVPPPYAGLRLPAAARDVETGERLFVDNCAPCHDEGGTGHGPGSVGLTKMPAALSSPGFLAARSDAYLFWRISEGKAGTPMPSFRQSLSAEERWAIIRWLREAWQR
jgi:mono/diheme cytochrome c family protein